METDHPTAKPINTHGAKYRRTGPHNHRVLFLIIGQVTLRWSHASTLIIRKNHKLRTRGIYRFTRNPMYLGVIFLILGIPVYASSLNGFLVMLLGIPVVLSRIRIEQKMLIEYFGKEYTDYMKRTKKLIPFIY